MRDPTCRVKPTLHPRNNAMQTDSLNPQTALLCLTRWRKKKLEKGTCCWNHNSQPFSLTEEESPSHSWVWFCFRVSLLTDETEHCRFTYEFFSASRSLISLTQDQEVSLQLPGTKGQVAEQAPPEEGQKLKADVILDREWDSKSHYSPICLISFWQGSKDAAHAASSKHHSKKRF